MKNLVKILVFVVLALTVNSVHAQETEPCPKTTVQVVYSTDKKENSNGNFLPKFAIIVLQIENTEGIPIKTKYYLGYGWKTETVISADGITVELTLKNAAGTKKHHVSTIKYTTNRGDWSFSKTNSN
jgi:hypothetical protein